MDARAIDREIVSVERHIKLLTHLKPTNLALERKLFLKGKKRNPDFRYRSLTFHPDELRERLNSLKPDRTGLGRLFQKKIEELYLKLSLLEARGTSKFSTLVESLYGKPTPELEADAKRILKTPHRIHGKSEKFSTREIQNILEEVLRSYGLTRWHVYLKDELVSDVAAGKRHALFVRAGVSFNRVRLDRIIAHEIETHILTAENGKFQPFRLFHRGFANYLETQEGLAIYAQECKSECLPISAHRVSYLTMGVAEASRSSFRNVYEMMRDFGFSEEKSFHMALRSKRGQNDTSLPGAFTKDLIYLSGYRLIEKFVKEGGNLKKLYVGKIALEDLPFITQIPGLAPPKYLPKWLTADTTQ